MKLFLGACVALSLVMSCISSVSAADGLESQSTEVRQKLEQKQSELFQAKGIATPKTQSSSSTLVEVPIDDEDSPGSSIESK